MRHSQKNKKRKKEPATDTCDNKDKPHRYTFEQKPTKHKIEKAV